MFFFLKRTNVSLFTFDPFPRLRAFQMEVIYSAEPMRIADQLWQLWKLCRYLNFPKAPFLLDSEWFAFFICKKILI